MAFCMNGQLTARAGRKHHQAHDAFAIHFFPVLFDENVAREAISRLDEHGRGPGMDPQLIGDHKVFRHH